MCSNRIGRDKEIILCRNFLFLKRVFHFILFELKGNSWRRLSFVFRVCPVEANKFLNLRKLDYKTENVSEWFCLWGWFWFLKWLKRWGWLKFCKFFWMIDISCRKVWGRWNWKSKIVVVRAFVSCILIWIIRHCFLRSWLSVIRFKIS